MKQNVAGPTAPTAIHEYLLTQLGTDKAWRTTAEIARGLGVDTPADRDSISKALWILRRSPGGPKVMTRKRAGANVDESMALVANASVRNPTQRSKPERAAIQMPAPGPVALRVEAVPAPALPEPSPEAREAVEKLVRSPTPALTLADVLEKHARSRMADRMEKAQADAVIATALESGPLEDSSGPIASDLAPEPGHEVDDTPDPVAEPDTETPDDPLDIELANVMEALQAPRRVPVHIHDLDKKLNVLSSIALCLPPITRRIVNGVVKDLERVHGS